MFKFTESVNFDDFTLIIACVSVGNTAQMSADLFISSLKMKKIASCWHPACIPIVGINPFAHDYQKEGSNSQNPLCSLSTALEMFYDPAKRTVVLQMRSCLARSLKSTFMTELINFISNHNFSKIIILTSSYSHNVTQVCDGVYYGSSLHYTGSADLLQQYNSILKSKDWILYNTEEDNGRLIRNIPGYAKEFYEKCIAKKLPAMLVFKYCTEGDNRDDAIKTTKTLNKWIEVLNIENDEIQLIIPPSWNCFFGNTVTANMF